jgi:hypothetical protein
MSVQRSHIFAKIMLSNKVQDITQALTPPWYPYTKGEGKRFVQLSV